MQVNLILLINLKDIAYKIKIKINFIVLLFSLLTVSPLHKALSFLLWVMIWYENYGV